MELDWNKCIICQQDKSEPLRCPMQTPGTSYEKMTDAYESFLTNIKQFQDINALPTKLSFPCDYSAGDLATHNASWHKSCHLKYNNSKLAKAKKRSISITSSDDLRTPQRKRQAMEVNSCLFCEKGQEEGDLHQVSTFDADSNIRTMITELQDTCLLT